MAVALAQTAPVPLTAQFEGRAAPDESASSRRPFFGPHVLKYQQNIHPFTRST